MFPTTDKYSTLLTDIPCPSWMSHNTLRHPTRLTTAPRCPRTLLVTHGHPSPFTEVPHHLWTPCPPPPFATDLCRLSSNKPAPLRPRSVATLSGHPPQRPSSAATLSDHTHWRFRPLLSGSILFSGPGCSTAVPAAPQRSWLLLSCPLPLLSGLWPLRQSLAAPQRSYTLRPACRLTGSQGLPQSACNSLAAESYLAWSYTLQPACRLTGILLPSCQLTGSLQPASRLTGSLLPACQLTGSLLPAC